MMLEEFLGGGSLAPKYAILSHTWGEGEVSFQDFVHPDKEVRLRKLGFQKIEKTCQLARKAGLYVWVDTCCIDKTSSAELNEALNSMFQWYQSAVVCYAWLADLCVGDSLSPADPVSCFKDCRWFTRGWTLQELIAPIDLEFYDQEWTYRGTKVDLSDVLSGITKIDAEVLRNAELLHRLPVAQRMSWAAARQTTRIEDMAYCLLGIFDVNMPMLYGEGSKAFTRLQEEIIRQTNDLSLFAWKVASTDQMHHGILASTVSEFRNSESISLINDTDFNPDFGVTNKGLRITSDLHLRPNGTYVMPLNCSQPDGKGGNLQIGISIKMHGGGVYSRVRSDKLDVINLEAVGKTTKTTSLFVRTRISPLLSASMGGSHQGGFLLRKGFNEQGVPLHDPDAPFEATMIEPKAEWDSQRRMFSTHGASSFTAYVFFLARRSMRGKLSDTRNFIIAFGKTAETSEPWLAVNKGRELAPHLRDLKKLGAVGSRLESRGLTLESSRYPAVRIEAALEKDVLDGQEVYCIDILYT